MTWTVKIHPRVIKQIKFWQQAYIHRFERLIDELCGFGPLSKTLDVRRMAGRENMYRARIGKNRVLYTVFPAEKGSMSFKREPAEEYINEDFGAEKW